jgi:hypothetical protein
MASSSDAAGRGGVGRAAVGRGFAETELGVDGDEIEPVGHAGRAVERPVRQSAGVGSSVDPEVFLDHLEAGHPRHVALAADGTEVREDRETAHASQDPAAFGGRSLTADEQHQKDEKRFHASS